VETAESTQARAARVMGADAGHGSRLLPRGSGWIAAAVVLAGVGAGLILASGQLVRPGWLAIQSVDLVVVSVAVGVYWSLRRPHSRFGPMLIVFGFLSAILALEASSSPLVHTTAAFFEGVTGLWTICLVLAFPSGRLDDRASRIVLGVATLAYTLWYVPALLAAPRLNGSVLAGCHGACPRNPFAVAQEPGFLTSWSRVTGSVFVVALILGAAVLVGRLASTPAFRLGAMAAGTVVGLVFLAVYAAYTASLLVRPSWETEADSYLRWTIVVSRAFVPWGFLLALLAAEIAAGRVLRRLVDVSLGSHTLADLEAALSDALGDRELRLGLWRRRDRAYVDAEGRRLPDAPACPRQLVTEARDGAGNGVAILHADLRGEPELAEAAAAGALLALDNARLESDLHETVVELRRSRARLVAAGDAERRRIERDLHDGAQQQLVALRIKLGLMAEVARGDAGLSARVAELASGLEEALEELRELAHGIYPPILADEGLGGALRAAALRSELSVTVDARVGRYEPQVEEAIYYVCLEALQNAAKHGGPDAAPAVSVTERDGRLTFMVVDRGFGFDPATVHRGAGMRSMEDRIGAVGGQLEIGSAIGSGTVVTGMAPLEGDPFPDTPQRRRTDPPRGDGATTISRPSPRPDPRGTGASRRPVG
jgi:signal transduction histidine kinase